MRKGVGVIVLFGWISSGLAQEAYWNPVALLAHLRDQPELKERILLAGEAFLGTPYALGTTGEGPTAAYDNEPVWRLDEFDCTTFVEAVLAFANVPTDSKDPEAEFEALIRLIKYNGEVQFVNRNHFTELNWSSHMQTLGLLSDITLKIDPEACEQTKTLNLEKWYQDKIDEVNGHSQDPMRQIFSDWTRFTMTSELSQSSPNRSVSPQARMHFVSLDSLLKPEIQEKILREKVVVFNLVKAGKIRPGQGNEVDAPTIVGHQGFLIAKNGQVYLRHAALRRQVLDVPLTDYVRERIKDTTWPTLGMNLMAVVSQD